MLDIVLTYAKAYQSLTVPNVPMNKNQTWKLYLFKQLQSLLNNFFSNLLLKLFFFQFVLYLYCIWGWDVGDYGGQH